MFVTGTKKSHNRTVERRSGRATFSQVSSYHQITRVNAKARELFIA